MADSNSPIPVLMEPKELYRILIDTRNFEINLFWQRSNYFLVLNSGLALGFFNVNDPRYALAMAVIGALASLMWFWICLGGKFWQARWEYRLAIFEKEHMPGIAFFDTTRDQVRSDVELGLASKTHGWSQRLIYRWVLRRPSVSYTMMRLSLLFVGAWCVFIGLDVLGILI